MTDSQIQELASQAQRDIFATICTHMDRTDGTNFHAGVCPVCLQDKLANLIALVITGLGL